MYMTVSVRFISEFELKFISSWSIDLAVQIYFREDKRKYSIKTVIERSEKYFNFIFIENPKFNTN